MTDQFTVNVLMFPHPYHHLLVQFLYLSIQLAINEPLLNVIHCPQYHRRGFLTKRAIWNENIVLFECSSCAKCYHIKRVSLEYSSCARTKPLQTHMAELFPSPQIKASPSLSPSRFHSPSLVVFVRIFQSFSLFVSRNGIVAFLSQPEWSHALLCSSMIQLGHKLSTWC